MAGKDFNISRLRLFRKRRLSDKKVAVDISGRAKGVRERLLPKRAGQAPRKGGDGMSDETKKALKAGDSRIKRLEKELAEAAKREGKDTGKKLASLNKSIKAGDESNLNFSDSLKSAIDNLYERQKSGDKKSAEGREKQAEFLMSEREARMRQAELLASEISSKDEDKDEDKDADTETRAVFNRPPLVGGTVSTQVQPPTTAAVNKIVEELKIGRYYNIGPYSYKVTNVVGQRSGGNAVIGKLKTDVSPGIDIVGYDAQGRRANLPISLTDGVIHSITLDGSGEAIILKELDPALKGKDKIDPEGGYIMSVKMANGKVIRYMHLGKDVMDQKDDLIGKKVKRGEILYPGDYSVGSGTQSRNHIKAVVSDLDKEGNVIGNHSDNNPVDYFF